MFLCLERKKKKKKGHTHTTTTTKQKQQKYIIAPVYISGGDAIRQLL